MHRKPFLDILRKYKYENSEEDSKLISELINHVLNNKNCFYRKKEVGAKDIAASVLLLSDDYKKALFTWHAKIQKWTQPGGHADGESNILTVALKELEEETGIENANFVNKIPIFIYRFDYPANVYGYKKSIYNLFFAATTPKNKFPKIMEPTKCKRMEWFYPNEMLSIIKNDPHEGTEELINKWLLLKK